MSAPQVWFNGCPVEAAADNVVGMLTDRGTSFGDGVFETMLVCLPGVSPSHREPLSFIHLSDLHLRRLQRGVESLQLPVNIDNVKNELRTVIASLVSEKPDGSGVRHFVLKLLVSRGASAFGYAPGTSDCQRTVIVSSHRLPSVTDPRLLENVVFSAVRLSKQPLLAGLKHCNRLEQVLAQREMAARRADEAIMRDTDGAIIEGVACNLFVLVDGELITPALQNCGVSGVLREFILQDLASRASLAVSESPVDEDFLRRADAVFLTNAIHGIRQLASLHYDNGDIQRWPVNPVVQELATRVLESMSRSIEVSGA